MGEFDDYWARAYRGDSGVAHSDPQRLVSTWTGAFALGAAACALGAAACVHHHASAIASHLKSLPHILQDMTMMLDQKHFKKILEKKQQA